MALYNGANREVAILCNHQRTVSNAQKDGLQRLEDRLTMFKKQKQVRRSVVHFFFLNRQKTRGKPLLTLTPG